MSLTDQALERVRALIAQRARGVVWLDSGRARPESSHTTPPRSYLFSSPQLVLTRHRDRFVELDAELRPRRTIDDPIAWLTEHGAPRGEALGSSQPWSGGIAGYLGFDFAAQLDAISFAPRPEPHLPSLWVGVYDRVEVFEHHPRRAPQSRLSASGRAPIAMAQSLGSPLDEAAASSWYKERVAEAIEAIVKRGDLFEINYTERFQASVERAPIDFYARLRDHAVGDFMGFVDTGQGALLSVSPEQFLSCEQRRLTARPIKGTARRDERSPRRDAELAQALQQSAKDRAENIMIVDLMRNDLTRVCALGSVRAERLCEVESFAGVHHLVSTIQGELAADLTPIEALLACFPAGSITGAPKLRAMEYIDQLEASGRGAYTGSLFYASRCGRLDSNVLIRSVELLDGMATYGAGGAVVARSSPEGEWQEALLKAEVFFRAAAAGEQGLK